MLSYQILKLIIIKKTESQFTVKNEEKGERFKSITHNNDMIAKGIKLLNTLYRLYKVLLRIRQWRMVILQRFTALNDSQVNEMK